MLLIHADSSATERCVFVSQSAPAQQHAGAPHAAAGGARDPAADGHVCAQRLLRRGPRARHLLPPAAHEARQRAGRRGAYAVGVLQGAMLAHSLLPGNVVEFVNH